MKRNTIFAAAALMTLAACGPQPQYQQPDYDYAPPVQQVDEEDEDCDAGDMAEGDSDCYGISFKRKHKVKAGSYGYTTPKRSTYRTTPSYSKPRSSSYGSSSRSSSSSSRSSSSRRR